MPRSFLVKKLKAEAFPAAGAPAPPYAPLEPPYTLPGPAAGDGECGAGGPEGPPRLYCLCARRGTGRETRGDAGQDGEGDPALCPAAGEGCGVGCVIPRCRLVPGATGRCRSWSLGKHPLRDSVSPVGSPESPPPVGHRGGLLPTAS